MTTETVTQFNQLALKNSIVKVLNDIGYETPSPIQAQTIPLLLKGKDVLGQAQTGTGKTAAFALPLLSNIDLKQKDPQVLVLAPTRELAIQVAEAFQKYASDLKNFHVLPIYGGQDYRGQIRGLERGVHIVVGTPGRVMDHMRRGTLKLANLRTLVLDEADEMLRMGFIDDVEWILEQTPPDRQIALFSATMPQQIRRIATKYLNEPEQVTIKDKTATAENIRQRYWLVSGLHKLDALTRILEAESFDGMLIFVRTKTATVELAEKLEARGYSTSALNGDIAQNQRERTIQQLKNGKIDILVATDVAARGLDVNRISHVVNYDIPYDTEAYIHRIGRTGRAGRTGDAILFVAPREKRLLGAIEKATRKKIQLMELPSTEIINDKRVANFKQKITDTLANEDLTFFSQLVEKFQQEHNVPAVEIGAALAKLLQGDTPLLLQHKPERKNNRKERKNDQHSDRPYKRRERSSDKDDQDKNKTRKPRERSASKMDKPEEGLQRYRIEVGHAHEVKPGNIVGAIASEAGLDGKYIGHIKIFDDHSLVDLPEGMPKEIFKDLKKTRVAGQPLNISMFGEDRPDRGRERKTIRAKPSGGKRKADEAKPKKRKSKTRKRTR
ncbi:MAG: DEAD/DEAH box helicase [Gammaproteobacteria bacterium]|nr:DEAD/DEAH box helicase [Gammaproteobacteria bacterium]